MNENDYDELKEFASRVQNDLMYDLKSHTSVIKQFAYMMQLLLDSIDATPEQEKTIEKLHLCTRKIEAFSLKADDKLNTYFEYTRKILKPDVH